MLQGVPMSKCYPFSICLLFILSMLSGCLGNLDTDIDGEPYLVKDINPGHYSSNPSEGVPINGNKLIFSASDGLNGTKLWISDGTAIGTQMIQNFSIDGNDEHSVSPHFALYSFGDIVFFELWYETHSSLWSTDGVSASLIVDFRTGGNLDRYNSLMLIGDNLIFSCDSQSSYSDFRYNLSDESITTIDKMTNVFQWNSEYYFTRDSSLFKLNQDDFSSELIFNFDADNSLQEPLEWHKIRILDANIIVFCIGEYNFWSSPDPYICEEIWLSDGTSNGTGFLKDNPGSSWSSERAISDYEVLNGKIFIASSHLYQLHLDGNQSIVRDLFPGSGDRIEDLHATSEFIYFEAYDGSTNLYMSDGTFAGTTRWKLNSGYPDIIHENDEQIILGFDELGTYLFKGDISTKIANRNWGATSSWTQTNTLGLTSTHLYISANSDSGDVGTELWAIQY
jgi:ELWxxDGT repeat protein